MNELFRLTPMDDDSNVLHEVVQILYHEETQKGSRVNRVDHYLNGENRRGPPNLFCVWIKRDLREYINRGVDRSMMRDSEQT